MDEIENIAYWTSIRDEIDPVQCHVNHTKRIQALSEHYKISEWEIVMQGKKDPKESEMLCICGHPIIYYYIIMDKQNNNMETQVLIGSKCIDRINKNIMPKWLKNEKERRKRETLERRKEKKKQVLEMKKSLKGYCWQCDHEYINYPLHKESKVHAAKVASQREKFKVSMGHIIKKHLTNYNFLTHQERVELQKKLDSQEFKPCKGLGCDAKLPRHGRDSWQNLCLKCWKKSKGYNLKTFQFRK